MSSQPFLSVWYGATFTLLIFPSIPQAIEFGLPRLPIENRKPTGKPVSRKQSEGEHYLSSNPNYSVIEQTGKFCPGRDSCKHRMRNGRGTGLGLDTAESISGPFKHARGGSLNSRGHFGVENDWKKRNCFCDNLCEMYGDCCVDAPIYQMSHQSQNHLNFECVSLKQYGDIYMRHQCGVEWNITNKNDAIIKDFCENLNTKSDPFGTTPVTNNVSGVTYRNYYCAICNSDAKPGTLRFWRPRLECPTLNAHVHRFKNISKEYVISHLRYSKARNVWGIDISMGGVEVFHDCYIDPVVPDEISHRIRLCSGRNTITSCPPGFNGNHTIKELCESYTALVFEPTKSFRNVHCAICNNASLESLYCLNLGPLGRSKFKQNFNLFSFAILFDIGGDLDTAVGQETQENTSQLTCDHDKVFDPFFKKCRTVYCHQSNIVYSNGGCVEVSIDAIADTIENNTHHGSSSSKLSSANISTLSSLNVVSTQSVPNDTVSITTSAVTSNKPPKDIIITTNAPSPNVQQSDTKSARDESISVNGSDSLINANDDKDITKDKPTNTLKGNFLDCPKFELQVGEFKVINHNDNADNVVQTDVEQEAEEVYIERYDKKLVKGEYSIKDDNKLVICAPYILDNSSSIDQKNVGIGKFGEYMGIVTFICLGVSILCLVIHIFVTLLLPELRNLSGKNLLSLCIALLGGYSSFVVSMFLEGGGGGPATKKLMEEDSGCFILAVFMYFFFLSSFFWMLVMAFDVYRTLKLATKHLQPIDSSSAMGGQWKKFAVYTLFGWVAPLTLVTATVVIEHLKESIPTEYRPGFGENGVCWFSNKRALLVYFAVPFGGVMGANIFLFVCSARMIYLTRKNASMKMITTTGCFNPKTNFILYVRLATIMGLTWVTGLVAGFIDVTWLWYTFVVFNTLQGNVDCNIGYYKSHYYFVLTIFLYNQYFYFTIFLGLLIFCMFTCNKNVFDSLKQKLCSSRYHVNQKSHYNFDAENDPNSWRWSSNERSLSSSVGSPSQTSENDNKDVEDLSTTQKRNLPPASSNPQSLIPSRYGSRSKTMYTLSKTQASDTALNINSFNGRYY